MVMCAKCGGGGDVCSVVVVVMCVKCGGGDVCKVWW